MAKTMTITCFSMQSGGMDFPRKYPKMVKPIVQIAPHQILDKKDTIIHRPNARHNREKADQNNVFFAMLFVELLGFEQIVTMEETRFLTVE
jgi:hypothetical protein